MVIIIGCDHNFWPSFSEMFSYKDDRWMYGKVEIWRDVCICMRRSIAVIYWEVGSLHAGDSACCFFIIGPAVSQSEPCIEAVSCVLFLSTSVFIEAFIGVSWIGEYAKQGHWWKFETIGWRAMRCLWAPGYLIENTECSPLWVLSHWFGLSYVSNSLSTWFNPLGLVSWFYTRDHFLRVIHSFDAIMVSDSSRGVLQSMAGLVEVLSRVLITRIFLKLVLSGAVETGR